MCGGASSVLSGPLQAKLELVMSLMGWQLIRCLDGDLQHKLVGCSSLRLLIMIEEACFRLTLCCWLNSNSLLQKSKPGP